MGAKHNIPLWLCSITDTDFAHEHSSGLVLT